MNKVQKFSLLCASVSSMLDGGKSELADMLGVRLDHLSKMLTGKKGVTDQRLALLEEIADRILPPGFGFQDSVVTDLSEIWDNETIVAVEAAAKLRGMTVEQYVKQRSLADLRVLIDSNPNPVKQGASQDRDAEKGGNSHGGKE